LPDPPSGPGSAGCALPRSARLRCRTPAESATRTRDTAAGPGAGADHL